MKRRMLVAFLVLTFGGAIALTLHTRGAGTAIPVDKYPPVPDEEFLKSVVPGADGKVYTCLDIDGVFIGSGAVDADFADPATPTWAKQAAMAAAQTSIKKVYNAKIAKATSAGSDGTAAAFGVHYVKFCDGCGGSTGCCTWYCQGVHDMEWCPDAAQGDCPHQHVICDTQERIHCGECWY